MDAIPTSAAVDVIWVVSLLITLGKACGQARNFTSPSMLADKPKH